MVTIKLLARCLQMIGKYKILFRPAGFLCKIGLGVCVCVCVFEFTPNFLFYGLILWHIFKVLGQQVIESLLSVNERKNERIQLLLVPLNCLFFV